jgi:formate dehydrogenase subunit delta
MDVEKLVRMANQIGTFFKHEGAEKAAASVLKHIKDFWDPRMRKSIVAHLDAGGAGLDGPVRTAIETLKSETLVKS